MLTDKTNIDKERQIQGGVKSQKIKLIVSIVTLIAFVLLIIALREQIIETYNNIARVNYWYLLLIPIIQLGNYHSYVQMYRNLLETLGERIRYRSMFRVQLELNFVNNVFPTGGVSGISYFGLRMRDADVAPGKSTLVQVMKFVLLFLSFQILLAVGLFLLALGGNANSFLMLIAGSLSAFLFVGTVLLAYILGSRQRIHQSSIYISKTINKLIHFFFRSSPETIKIEKVTSLFTDLHEGYLLFRKKPTLLKKPLIYSLLANLTEVLTIYVVYMAFGEFVNPGAVIIAYAVANIAGLISVLPGGIGVYEALMTATLAAAGVPAALSLPVTVMYRILNSFVQLVPGYYFYSKNLHKREAMNA